MFYLIPKGTKIESKRQSNDRISDTDIFVTRQEKLEFIRYAHESYPMILNILEKLYPELKEIKIDDYYASSYNCYSNLTLGLSIQAIIAIIENPNMICTGTNVKLPYQKFHYNFISLTKIIRIEYNGNYCLLIGKVYNQYYIERIMLSHEDDQLAPAHAEWIYSKDNVSYQCAIMDKKAFSTGAQLVFIEDKLLDDFINKEYVNVETVYIYVHSFEYIKQIDLVRKSFKNVHFIINIKEFAISDYARLKEFSDETLLIFLNKEGNERFSKAIFKESFIFSSNYLIEEGLLDSTSKDMVGRIINFRTFGLIRDEDMNFKMLDKSIRDSFFQSDAFVRLRNELGLPCGQDVTNANVYRHESSYII